MFKNRDEKFCPHCLTWYNNSITAGRSGANDKHVTGKCAPLTRGDLDELKEMIKGLKEPK